MMQPLLLDALLVLVIFLLIPIGVHRGGLREVCTAGGLLLGMHLVDEWAGSWGARLSDMIGVVPNVTTFVVAVLILLLTTAFVGYGATATFASTPGAGGRMYGAILAFLIGAVFLGSILSYVNRYLYEGDTPEIVTDGYISRALSFGLGWILLAAASAILLTTLFGLFVRERDSDEFVIPIARAPVTAPSTRIAESVPAREAEKIEPARTDPQRAAADDMQRTAPIKIREVRHWDERQSPETSSTGSRWNQTWPQGSGRSTVQRSHSSQREGSNRRPMRRNPADAAGPVAPATNQDDATVLRDWLAENGETGSSGHIDRRGHRQNHDD